MQVDLWCSTDGHFLVNRSLASMASTAKLLNDYSDNPKTILMVDEPKEDGTGKNRDAVKLCRKLPPRYRHHLEMGFNLGRPQKYKVSLCGVLIEFLKLFFILASILAWGFLLAQYLCASKGVFFYVPQTVPVSPVPKRAIALPSPVLISAPEKSEKSSCLGSGWISFYNQKCFKLIQVPAKQKDAFLACLNEYTLFDVTFPELVSPGSAWEQDFLMKRVLNLTKPAKQNIWTGVYTFIKRGSDGQLESNFLGSVSFTNWAGEPLPPLESENNCVQMNGSTGKWRLVSCETKNWVLCEKPPKLTTLDLQSNFLFTQKYQERTIKLIQYRLEALNKTSSPTSPYSDIHLTEFGHHFIPLGFVYVQLPGQSPAAELWPKMDWQEVNTDYPRLFLGLAELANNQEDEHASETAQPKVWKRVG